MIVTFTDFGVNGPYMGQMKAAILNISTTSKIVDLMCDAPTFNVRASSVLLAALTDHMPSQSCVYLCVVDPGVGSPRRPICLNCDGVWFVGPDNGLFQKVIEGCDHVKSFEILWEPEHLSHTFHGRDLFAPIAAMLDAGIAFDKKAIPIDSLENCVEKDSDDADIIYIDDYGNCWTSLTANMMDIGGRLKVGNITIPHASYFSDVKEGEAFWYVNSSGLIEISVNQGNAKLKFDLKTGDRVKKL